MQALGEIGAAPKIGESPVVERLPEKAAEAVAGMSRGQFLKGVGGAAIAMSALSSGTLLPSTAYAAEDPNKSTGTPVQRNAVKSIVLNSKWYKDLAAAQSQIGSKFDWSRAVTKVRSASFAKVTVFAPDPGKRREVLIIFFVNVKRKSIFAYQGAAFTPKGTKEITVSRLFNGAPAKPYRHVTAGNNYVVLANGTKLSPEQFRSRVDKEMKQERQRSAHQRQARSMTYERCMVEQGNVCDQYQAEQDLRCGIGLTVLGAATLVPVAGVAAGLGAAALGATCVVAKRVGCGDPEEICRAYEHQSPSQALPNTGGPPPSQPRPPTGDC
jgi:hypothetical protein